MENVLNEVDSRHVQRVNAQLLNDLSISCKNGNQFNRTGGFTFPGAYEISFPQNKTIKYKK